MCLSVCLFGRVGQTTSCAKTAEPIEMPFREGVPRNYALSKDPGPPGEGAFRETSPSPFVKYREHPV